MMMVRVCVCCASCWARDIIIFVAVAAAADFSLDQLVLGHFRKLHGTELGVPVIAELN